MKTRSWPILALGFAVLVAMIATFRYSAMGQARIIHDEMLSTHQRYLQTEAFLQGHSYQYVPGRHPSARLSSGTFRSNHSSAPSQTDGGPHLHR